MENHSERIRTYYESGGQEFESLRARQHLAGLRAGRDSRFRERESGRLEAGEEGKVLEEALRLFALLHQQKVLEMRDYSAPRGYKAANDRL